MYELYLQGHSLARVAHAFGVTRQSVYKMFLLRGLEMRRRPQPLPFVLFQGRRYTLRNTGYYGCTSGSRGLLHRHIWEEAHGAIPDGWDVHHKNGDKVDNRLSNLEGLPKEEHSRQHQLAKRDE